MYKLSGIAFLISLSTSAYSAEALLSGEGQVQSAPDFVEITLSVDSKCYATPGDARKVNDEASRKIVDFLNSKIQNKNNYNNVITTGGYTLPYQNYYRDKIVCLNTFQKNNTIVFRTQDMKNFETLFNDIQNRVYKEFKSDPASAIESEISYVTISDPIPSISDDVRAQLENSATALAFTNAKNKLYALLGKDKIKNLKMTQASEFAPDEPTPIFRSSSAPMMVTGRMQKNSEQAPVQFDEKKVNKTIYFKFVFDDISLD